MTGDPNSPQDKISSTSGEEKSLSSNAAGAAATALQTPTGHSERRFGRFELWLHRITVLMFVFVCAAVGVLLVILPWRPEWTDNYLLLNNPGLRAFISNGFVRGICSGLGLLDIWVGFWEAIHYHEGHPV